MAPEIGSEPGPVNGASATAVPYETAVAEMESRVAAIRDGTRARTGLAAGAPALYTAGTSARAEDLLDPDVFRSTKPAAAANTPITGRASASPM